MNVSEKRKIADVDNREYKMADMKRKLGADAKIILTLIDGQPLSVDDLCKRANINKSTFYRWRRLLKYEGVLKETPNGYALWFYSELPSVWETLKHNLEQVRGSVVEIAIQKSSYAGRDPETGWRVYDHDIEGSIKGIMVLKSATRLVNATRSSGIYIEENYGGSVLTSDPIGFMDRLLWKNKLYEVRDVEEKLDGYDFSFYVAKLDELPLGIEEKAPALGKTLPPTGVFDPRNEIRTFLTTYLSKANILKGDDSEAAYCVIYTGPPYDIVKEFRASNRPVDGVFAIGEPDIRPLFSGSQTPWGHEIRVPIFIFTIDKDDVTGTKLKWAMEAELRRVSETFQVAHVAHMQLEKRGDRDERRGSIVLHSTEYILGYERSVSP